jgi:hypothetical protein
MTERVALIRSAYYQRIALKGRKQPQQRAFIQAGSTRQFGKRHRPSRGFYRGRDRKRAVDCGYPITILARFRMRLSH